MKRNCSFRGTSETIFFDTNRERPWKPREGSSIFCGIQPNSIGFHCKIVFFHCSTTPVVGVTLGELEKLISFNKTKINLSFRVTWCFFNVPVQELQTSRVATPQRELIYTLIHGRDQIPCRTTYIEYKSQGEDSPFFNRNTTQFHWFSLQSSFFHCSTTPVVGVTLGELEKLFFFTQNKKTFIISGDLVCFFMFQFRSFRHPGSLLPKGIDLYPYTWKRPNSLQNYIHRI